MIRFKGYGRVHATMLFGCLVGTGCEGITDPSARFWVEAVSETELVGRAGQLVEPTPSVRVTDADGVPVAGATVSFALKPTSGSVALSRTVTNAAGEASAGAWTLGGGLGLQTLSARVQGGDRVAFTAFAEAGPAAFIEEVDGYDQVGAVGEPLPRKLRVWVGDWERLEGGHPVADVPVTFAVIAGGGAIEGGAVLTGSDGIAESGTWTLGTEPVTQRVLVQAGVARAFVEAYAFEPGVNAKPLPPCSTAPDCGTIAFVSERDGNYEIYSMRPDGTVLARLTNDAAVDRAPAWSPDGAHVAFVSDREGGTGDIYVMDADGSDVVRRTFGASYPDDPAWSPDGARIAYRGGGTGSADIWVVSSEDDGTAPSILVGRPGWEGAPTWSPDGVRVAFESDWNAYDFVQDIFVVGSDGSSPVLLTTGDIFDRIDYTRPSWSPDGARIAITIQNQARGDAQIAVIPSDDGESPTSLALSAPWSGGAWSPDGELILYDSPATDALVFQVGDSIRVIRNINWVRADGSEAGIAFLDGWDADWGR